MKGKFFRRSFFLIFCISAIRMTWGAEISLHIDKSKAMLGEPVTMTITVSGANTEPKIVIPTGLTVRAQSKSQKIEIVNFNMNSSVIHTLVLVASHSGNYTLGPAKVEINGQVLTSNQVSLVVTDQKSTQIPGTPQGIVRPFSVPNFPRTAQDMKRDQQKKSEKDPERSKGEPEPSARPTEHNRPKPHSEAPPLAFIDTSINKTKAYVGEPLHFAVLFYTRVPFLSQPRYQAPSTSGFWHEELPQQTFQRNVDGVAYHVTKIPMVLFPSAAGPLEIGPARITVELEKNQDLEPMDPFNPNFFQQFFGMGAGETHVLETKKIRIEALPLPQEGRPADFSGAVGQFDIEAQIDKPSIKIGDSLTWTVTVKGTGNIRGLPSPQYPDLGGAFRSYETEKTEAVSKEGGTITGSKMFKTLLIPQIPGRPDLVLPPVKFVYFDPVEKRYFRKETKPIAVRVTGEPLPAAASQAPKLAKQAAVLSQDIRYIQTGAPGRSWIQTTVAWAARQWMALAAAPLALWAAALTIAFARRKRESAGKDPLYQFSAAIAQARRATRTGSIEHAASLLAGAVRSLLDKKLKGDSPERQTFKRLLEDLDYLRFAPVAQAPEMLEEILTRADQAKKILERLR